MSFIKSRNSCICSNKDKNFKANHNTFRFLGYRRKVVSVVTKIRILKQITTVVSKPPRKQSCICSNKDKNFKANHNQYRANRGNDELYL